MYFVVDLVLFFLEFSLPFHPTIILQSHFNRHFFFYLIEQQRSLLFRQLYRILSVYPLHFSLKAYNFFLAYTSFIQSPHFNIIQRCYRYNNFILAFKFLMTFVYFLFNANFNFYNLHPTKVVSYYVPEISEITACLLNLYFFEIFRNNALVHDLIIVLH